MKDRSDDPSQHAVTGTHYMASVRNDGHYSLFSDGVYTNDSSVFLRDPDLSCSYPLYLLVTVEV